MTWGLSFCFLDLRGLGRGSGELELSVSDFADFARRRARRATSSPRPRDGIRGRMELLACKDEAADAANWTAFCARRFFNKRVERMGVLLSELELDSSDVVELRSVKTPFSRYGHLSPYIAWCRLHLDVSKGHCFDATTFVRGSCPTHLLQISFSSGTGSRPFSSS